MTREEYEERRRALDAQLQTDVALVHAGHEARVRSLESLWQAAKAGDGKAAVRPRRESAAPQTAARPPGATYNDLLAALPRLPEVFDKRDVVRELGKSSLHDAPARAGVPQGIRRDRRAGGLGYRRSFRKITREGEDGPS